MKNIYTKTYTELAELPLVLDVTDVADLLHTYGDNVRRMCREGKIPGAIHIGKHWKIPKQAIINLFGGKL